MDILTGLNNTPAPWNIKREDIGDDCFCVVPIEIIGADGFKVVSSEGGLAPNEPWKAETIEANANLIAASPDMYGALKALMQAFNKLSGGLPDATFTDPYFLMFNAIKKAEGKEI